LLHYVLRPNNLMVNNLFHHLPQPEHDVFWNRRAFEWIDIYLFECALYSLKCFIDRI